MNLCFSHLASPFKVACFISLLGFVGCGGTKSAKPAPAQTESVFAPFGDDPATVMGGKQRTKAGEPEKKAPWSIVIVSAGGEAADSSARDMLMKVQTRGNLPEAFTERRGNAVVVAYGAYEGPDDAAAQRDLQRIRSMEIDGARPFENATLSPPPFKALTGGIPQFNLATLKQSRGKNAVYTLQVAMYTRLGTNVVSAEDLRLCREKAEEAVVELRREGEEAFYFHGPHGSMVTVGVFNTKDHDESKPSFESFALNEARRKHPMNLVNGAPLMERSRGQVEPKPQRSFLVPIPN